jgi:hypothetical protein
MLQPKTLRVREKELQELLAHPAGRQILQDLENRYWAQRGRLRPPGSSVVTYIQVHERERGLISG